MKRIIMTIGFVATTFSGLSFASEVTEGVDTKVFSDGEAALAGEVNDNFAALIAAINDNAQRIADLEQSATNVDVTDRSYKLLAYEIALEVPEDGGVPSGKKVISFQENIVVTFSAGGTVSASSNATEAVMDLDPTSGEVANLNISSFSDSPSLSWSQTDNTITVTEGAETVLVLTVSPDGRILTAMDNATDTEFGQAYFSTLFVGVEEL